MFCVYSLGVDKHSRMFVIFVNLIISFQITDFFTPNNEISNSLMYLGIQKLQLTKKMIHLKMYYISTTQRNYKRIQNLLMACFHPRIPKSIINEKDISFQITDMVHFICFINQAHANQMILTFLKVKPNTYYFTLQVRRLQVTK